MKKPESQLQQHCVRWFRYSYPDLTLFAIPNEGKRSIKTASRMKAEGMLAGVADLFLCQPSGKYHGLFIEMKYDKGKQTDSQRDFENRVTWAGYKYALCRSFDEFLETIENYLK